MRSTLVCLFVVLCTSVVVAQDVIPLWKNGAPGFENRRNESEQAESYWVKNVHNPSVTAFLPPKDKATGAAVVVCPGGGHRLLVFNAEGVEAAEYLNSIGVAAFVLKYRLGREENSPYKIDKHAKQDGQRAVRLVRSLSKEWGVDPSRIGMLGFSAGGEVVSMVTYASDNNGKSDAADPIDRASSRPDFQVMVYPGPLGIPGKLPPDVPPALLVTANDDGAASNIVDLLQKYRQVVRPVECHIFSHGGHAFNMGRRTKLKTLKDWPARMRDWMADNYLLDTTGREDHQKKLDEYRKRILNRRRAKSQK